MKIEKRFPKKFRWDSYGYPALPATTSFFFSVQSGIRCEAEVQHHPDKTFTLVASAESGIEVARKKGIYKGRKKGTTKGEPARARELRAKGLKVAEIAQAMGTSRQTIQRYLAA